MKYLIFDSGPLINFSMNGLIDVLGKLKQTFDGKFVTTDYVMEEVCGRPMKIKQFELGALRISELKRNKILELPQDFGIDTKALARETIRLTSLANNSLYAKGQPIKIVSEAEISCIALSNMLSEKGHQTMIAIDERTARLLGEKPDNLSALMSSKLHQKVISKKENLSEYKNLKFIRSPEIIYVAYKKGLIELHDSRALEALLYATKFKGAAISWDEINVLKNL